MKIFLRDEDKIKTFLERQLTVEKISSFEDLTTISQQGPPYTVGGNVNWYNHYGKQYGGTSEN